MSALCAPPGAPRLYDDVRTLTAARLAADLGRLPSVIVGSPPCQDASVANTTGQGVDGVRTGLFFEAIRLVRECRPIWCCFENVPGLRTRGIDRVLDGLEAEGYTPWPLVVGARHVGAPHKRDRVWIVACDTTRQPMGGSRQPWEAKLGHVTADPNRPGSKTGWAAVGGPEGGNFDGFRLDQKDAPDPNRPRLAQWEGEPGDDGAELPPALGAIGRAWRAWGKPLARHLRMADGVPARVARACIAAYGDAVVPQIPEAIGRVMMRLAPTDGSMLDLFCGAAGGWSLGMHCAGYRTIAACEIDPWRRAVFAANFGAAA